MSREIKFRAWDTEESWFTEEDIMIDLEGSICPPFHDYEGTFHPVDESGRYIIQQYTGLKDKNGKEIYEGDILSFPDGERISVIWMEYPAAFSPMDSHQASQVIGNIYENPELLMGEES